MRIFSVIGVIAAQAATFWASGVALAQPPAAFLSIEKVAGDIQAGLIHVTVKNVGAQKVTAFTLVIAGQPYTQELFYAAGMGAKLVAPPPGTGGIRPGESVDLIFPSRGNGTTVSEVSAVVLEDQTAAGDETHITSIFQQRQAYVAELERWALVLQEDPAHPGAVVARQSERTELARMLSRESDEVGVPPAVAARTAARRTLASMLIAGSDQPALAEHLRSRAAVLQQYVRRDGLKLSFAPRSLAEGVQTGVRPAISAVRTDSPSCRLPGQIFGISGHAEIAENEEGTHSPEAASLAASAVGVCGNADGASSTSAPICTPQFFATTSSSPSAGTMISVSYSYMVSVGCTIAMTQSSTVPAGKLKPRVEPEPCTEQGCNYSGVAAYTPDPYLSNNANGLTAGTQRAIACMQSTNGVTSFQVTFGYRPADYQTHLYNVYTKYYALIPTGLVTNGPPCAAVYNNVMTEWGRHAPFDHIPGVTSSHTSGTAFDAAWTVTGNLNIDTAGSACNLSRCVSGDAHHWCYTGP